MLGLQVDTKQFEEYMAKLIAISNRSVNDVVKEQAVGLAKELVFVTQPFGDNDVAKKKGMNAVKRALILSITPAEQLYKPFENESVRKMVKKKDIKGLEIFNERVPNMKNYRFEPFSVSTHQNYKRKNRYDIRDSQKIITTDQSSWNRYLKVLENRVGMLKSGWAKILVSFGSRVPAWIRRHIGNFNFGDSKMQLNDNTPNPSIEISNILGRGDKGVVEQAMQRQVGKMQRNYEARLAHFLKNPNSGPKPTNLT